MLALFNTRRNVVAAFIKDRQPACRSEQDYSALFHFYNNG